MSRSPDAKHLKPSTISGDIDARFARLLVPWLGSDRRGPLTTVALLSEHQGSLLTIRDATEQLRPECVDYLTEAKARFGIATRVTR